MHIQIPPIIRFFTMEVFIGLKGSSYSIKLSFMTIDYKG
jgi:hypothetical protein